MPLRFELRENAIWVVTEGDVDYASGLETLELALETAARHAPGQLWDIVFDIVRSEEERSSMELREIARFVAQHANVLSGRCAVVAGDDFHFGLGRQFGAYSEDHGVEVNVLRGPDSVGKWLSRSSRR